MRQLSAFVFDSRYSVPTLRLVLASGADAARQAHLILEESPFHEAVELRSEDELLVRVERSAASGGRDGAEPCRSATQ